MRVRFDPSLPEDKCSSVLLRKRQRSPPPSADSDQQIKRQKTDLA